MSFPVNSTSLYTQRLRRAVRLVQARVKLSACVGSAGVYNCRVTAGTSLLSAHAYGDAADLMFKEGTTAEQRERLALAIIRDATEKTVVNHGKKTQVNFVIWKGPDGNRQWVRGEGITPYSGVDHASHIHMACSFSVTKPNGFECGDRLPVPYV